MMLHLAVITAEPGLNKTLNSWRVVVQVDWLFSSTDCCEDLYFGKSNVFMPRKKKCTCYPQHVCVPTTADVQQINKSLE